MVDAEDTVEASRQRENRSSLAFEISTSDLEPIVAHRREYIDLIKRVRTLPVKYDRDRIRGLPTQYQSLLQLLRSEAVFEARTSLLKATDKLDKVPLSMAIEERVGYRPDSLVFYADDWGGDELMRQIDGLMQAGGAVYLKTNKAYHGEYVVRISRKGNQYVYATDRGSHAVDDLRQYKPRKTYEGSDMFIVEAEIPIARTVADRAWEIRFLPPFSTDYLYCKVGAEGSIVNNIARQGERKPYREVLEDVVLARFREADDEQVAQIVDNFINIASQVAAQVKGLTDDFQIQVAKAIIRPEDLKDPSKYDEIMRFCFTGNFLTVDITGIWDENDRLVPRIIEAQPSAGLPDTVAYSAYEECLEQIHKKIFTLWRQLK